MLRRVDPEIEATPQIVRSVVTAHLDALAAALADPDCDVDAWAEVERELLNTRDPDLIPHLRAHLANAVEAGNWYARSVLAGILAETAGRTAMPDLLQAYSRDLGDDQDSLSTTLHTFATEDPAAARGVLVPWADAPDQDLRRVAIHYLGYVPDPADIALLARAAGDTDEGIRTAAAATLASHRTIQSALEILVTLLGDLSTQVRVSALDSLGYIRNPATLPAIGRLADDDTPTIRAWVAIVLARFPTTDSGIEPAILDILDQLASDPDPYVREKAVEARQLTLRPRA